MLDKRTYISQVHTQLNNWKNEIQQLRERVDTGNQDARSNQYRVIDEIVERQHLVENKLNEFEITGDEVLGHWETEIDNLRHQVQSAFDSARSVIN